MKYFAFAALVAAIDARHTAAPIDDSFVWVSDESADFKKMHVTEEDTELIQTDAKVRGGDGTLSRVELKFTNPLKSPGEFLPHEWGFIQDCQNNNSDEDAWGDETTNKWPGYLDAMGATYPSLVQLNAEGDWNENWASDKTDPKFRGFDPCEALANNFKRPKWM